MDITVRRGEPEDALFLTSISFGAKRHWNYSEEYLQNWHEQLTITEDYIRNNVVFLAQKKNTIIGYCSIVEANEANYSEIGFEEPGYWLDHIYIRPAYIQTGIGKTLMEEVNTYCRENEIELLKIESDPNANGFFEKLGATYIKDIDEMSMEHHLCYYEYKVPNENVQQLNDEEKAQLLQQMSEIAEKQEEVEINEPQVEKTEEATVEQEEEQIEAFESEIIESPQSEVSEMNPSTVQEASIEAHEEVETIEKTEITEEIQEDKEVQEDEQIQEPGQSQENIELTEAEETDQEESEEQLNTWILKDKAQMQDFHFSEFNVNYQPVELDESLVNNEMESENNKMLEDEENNIFNFSAFQIKPLDEDSEQRRMRLERELLEQKLRELDNDLDDEETLPEVARENTFENIIPEKDEEPALEEVVEQENEEPALEEVVEQESEEPEEKSPYSHLMLDDETREELQNILNNKYDSINEKKAIIKQFEIDSELEEEEVSSEEETLSEEEEGLGDGLIPQEDETSQMLIKQMEIAEEVEVLQELEKQEEIVEETKELIENVNEKDASIKSEKEKMLSGEPYIEWGDEFADDKRRARRLLKEFNNSDPEDKKVVDHLLKELLGSVGEYIHIEPSFKCNYGYNIHVGDNFFADYNCVILDNCPVTIGRNCILSPQVGIYTQSYPLDAEKRIAGYEQAKPVTIGDNVWIGAGSIINPGVTIGDNAVVEPGSVVMEDVLPNTLVGGNPARLIRQLNKE